MAQPGITAVLVGARNIRQVEENARGADLKIDRTALDKINTLLEPLGQQLDL
jgi:aryl-alcohol dehydrogenase-like predicted oxidoreductase